MSRSVCLARGGLKSNETGCITVYNWCHVFFRIELLLVVTVYVYSCDVPYLVICLICDGGYHI